ncbi:Cleavage and polyadenylation specificity factor subunit 1 [Papilio machaon]|uniref:Cleavage and polyadenylation specificity factor subunit 1 n=1 Tax=Papilio machaon TaxID=76193 RepID=A0A0N1IPS6_PAPMA|nr:Cleavage and polyadenylation specificity factor subunit 1 [Papilio machaon]
MFSICRQTHPATGIEHAISCCFFNNEESCLVTAGANIIKVFRLMPEGHTKEVNAAGQPIPPKMKLECLATYTLWGNVMSIASVKCASAGRDLLLLSFKEAKLSIVQYDPQINNLVTLSMHYFEEDDMKGGWTTHPHIPWIRVDPEFRCAVMLLYGKKLAVLPFRKDITSEEGDPLEAKPLVDSKKNQPNQQITKSPTLASYVIVLKDLDEKIDNILDIQFLYGYYEPTLLLLYEPVRTFPGRTAVRSDTCCMAGVSLNMSARVHPVIWATAGLPFDCIQAIPVQKPLGIQEGVCITLDGARVAALGESRLALALRGGQLYVLTLLSDSVRSVRSFHLDRAAASVLTSCMCVIEEDFLFLGSRLGNSLLLRVTERENRMLFSVDKPLEATVDLTMTENDKETPTTITNTTTTNKEPNQKEVQDPAAKKRRLDTISDCLPTNVIEISDKDELEVYGSDIRTSTQLTSYVFEVCDSLLNICPIGDISMGEPQLVGEEERREGAELELVACSGRGKNGALSVLQRSVRPQLVTAFHLPGCIDMWTVIGESEGRESRDAEGSHAYLILTQEDSSMILQTGQEINEVDNSGFMTGSPTVFAGNLGNNKYMVQVTTTAIRLIRNGVQLQSIQLEWAAVSAAAADPYVCVQSACGRATVLALRELRPRDPMSARLAPTRQGVPVRPALVRAVPYRDLSGLFTSTDTLENVQVKGEFSGKVKTGKNVKAEGFKPGAVYELNDDDELLYGGDQTPASMASIMLAEQSKNPGVPRRISRWWKRHLAEVKPTFWLFVVRDNGNLEIYSLPEMRLSFLVRDVCAGHRGSLRICLLPTHLSYDAPWAVRKVPLRATPHAVTFHAESRTYCLVCSTSSPQTSYYRFNGEDKEKANENKGDRFPYPMQERFSVMLFSPVSWEVIPNTKIVLEDWEHVTCLKNVALSYEGTRSGLRGYIAIGTNYNYGEDITSRGRIIIYDIIDVVPEPGQPLTKNRFKEIYAKEQKGPVTALAQVLGYLISAVGQKIYIWQLKDNDLVGVAFIDTQIYVHRLLAVKNLILVADVYKSVSLLRYQDKHRTLSLVSRDLRSAQIYEMQFMVDNTTLAFLVSEADGNLALFMYQPQARESYGGQRLIRKGDYHLGQQVHAMFRIAARVLPETTHRRHVTMFTTLDGGLGYVLPVSEKAYRRLLMLQNVMNNYCCHIAGLNPRAFRTYKSSRRAVGGGPARGILDGDLITLFTSMPSAERHDIAKKIGTKVDEVMSDLYEIDRLTAHF